MGPGEGAPGRAYPMQGHGGAGGLCAYHYLSAHRTLGVPSWSYVCGYNAING